MCKRLQLDAFGVPDDSDGTDLDAVQSRESHRSGAHPHGTAVLHLGPDVGLVHRGESLGGHDRASPSQKGEATVGFPVHLVDVIRPQQVGA